jgi:hypothetical protein
MRATHVVTLSRSRAAITLRSVRFVMALLWIVVMPLALGPATTPLTRWLGGEADHRCSCGMKAGTCGCPECERLERIRAYDREHESTNPLVKTACDTNDDMLRSQTPCASIPTMPAIARASRTRHAHTTFHAHLESIDRAPPPTPPPRNATA